MTNTIKFHSYHPSNLDTANYKPEPVKNNIPEWFLNKEKFNTNPDGTYQLDRYKHGGSDKLERVPSWKSCPALLDVFVSGYYLFTPCDITFKPKSDIKQVGLSFKEAGNFLIEYDEKWKNHELARAFCDYRGVEDGLPNPDGYSPNTLVWRPNWYFEVPKGYTVFFTHPINIVDLPFKTMSGFNDASNKHIVSGNYPFYIKENWYGTIPAGTPYAQIIPIKIESWSSEILNHSINDMAKIKLEKNKEYAAGHGKTKYKEIDWTKKDYK